MASESGELTRDRVLIVGASRGIGLATACYLARAGDDVTSWSRRGAPVEAIDEKIRERIRWEAVDVRDCRAVRTTYLRYQESGHFVQSIVYAAGIARWGRIGEQSYDEFVETYAVNTIGAFNVLSEYVAAYKRHPLRVIALASDAALFPAATRSAYHSSKTALSALLESYRQEARRDGALVTVIYLGKVNTSLVVRPEERSRMALQPAEVAALVGYLLKLPRNLEIRSLQVSSITSPFGGSD